MAHPLVENALDVVIGRDRVTIDAKISREQIAQVEAKGAAPPPDWWPDLVRKHADYVARHLRIAADDADIKAASVVADESEAAEAPLHSFHLIYPLPHPPDHVLIDQSFLTDQVNWSASCILRVRQEDQAGYETALLTSTQSAVFPCNWGAAAPARPGEFWKIVRSYIWLGIMHILTGYDHLLFVSALVLAVRSLWDLIKVVSAFTLAHTCTLALSVFNIVTLSERIVEPMIAASIVFVALQNVIAPRRSRGWVRLAVAFGFGLFHGLGFAGGLKDAMNALPAQSLWAALASFSAGVEIGHQVVVLPLFAVLYLLGRGDPAAERGDVLTLAAVRRFGSAAISLAGTYFFFAALGYLPQIGT